MSHINNIHDILCLNILDTFFKHWNNSFNDEHDVIYLTVFVENIILNFNLKYNNLLYIIIYIKRIMEYNINYNNIKWKKIFIGLTIISLKHSDEFSNDKWLNLLNISKNKMNKIENETLKLLKNKIYITEKELKFYKEKLKLRF